MSGTLLGVLGFQRDEAKYSVYVDKDAIIDVKSNLSKDVMHLGNIFNLNVTTDLVRNIVDSKTVYDTKYFNEKMGVKITIYDNNGNQLNSDSLLGVSFLLDETRYYPRIDGTTRIKIADKVSNVLSKISVDTSNNTTLATGKYKIRVESFGSPDGIYYGLETSDYDEKEITIINMQYGLKVTIDDKSKIVDKETGKTLNGNNLLDAVVAYSSELSNPKITTSFMRRDYSSAYSMEYKDVDLRDYITNTLIKENENFEYIFSSNPSASNTFSLNLKTNLKTGTYKLVFKLYDGDVYVGEAYEYIIIK